jgi:hypothetical protein
LVYLGLPEAGQEFETDGKVHLVQGFLAQICLKQVHVSEVNSLSKHDRLSYTSIRAFQEVAGMIPPDVPLILETPVEAPEMKAEIEKVKGALPVGLEVAVVWVRAGWKAGCGQEWPPHQKLRRAAGWQGHPRAYLPGVIVLLPGYCAWFLRLSRQWKCNREGQGHRPSNLRRRSQ